MKPVKPDYAILLLVIMLALAAYVFFVPELSEQPHSPAPAPVGADLNTTRVPSGLKMDQYMDPTPPQVLMDNWSTPVPVDGLVNTAGIEDSPYISGDGYELFYFYTPDSQASPRQQARDGVTGIWRTRRAVNGMFQTPDRVITGDGHSLDGCPFVQEDTLWFCSARKGTYRDVDIYMGQLDGLQCVDCNNLGKLLNKKYEVGELFVTEDGDAIYFQSNRPGGKGGRDIWVTTLEDGQWQEPENVADVNTSLDEGFPFISANGIELWYTRPYEGSTAIFRSVLAGKGWSEGKPVITGYAYEPCLDSDGNIYFSHHYVVDGSLVESDIFVAYKRSKG